LKHRLREWLIGLMSVSAETQRHHVVGMVGAAGASDVVGELVGQRIGLGELALLPEQPAERVDGAERITVLRLEDAAAVVHVPAEDGFGRIELVIVPNVLCLSLIRSGQRGASNPVRDRCGQSPTARR
jgi:hypothetical protein